MTYTLQPLARNTVKKAETVENIMDGNIQRLLSVCDSLNMLCEALGRLEYTLKRRNIEISLINKL